jgi:hypothetical protein
MTARNLRQGQTNDLFGSLSTVNVNPTTHTQSAPTDSLWLSPTNAIPLLLPQQQQQSQIPMAVSENPVIAVPQSQIPQSTQQEQPQTQQQHPQPQMLTAQSLHIHSMYQPARQQQLNQQLNQHSIQQQIATPLLQQAPPILQPTATLIAGPNGQQIILNPSASASLFESKQDSNANASNIQQQQQNIFAIQPPTQQMSSMLGMISHQQSQQQQHTSMNLALETNPPQLQQQPPQLQLQPQQEIIENYGNKRDFLDLMERSTTSSSRKKFCRRNKRPNNESSSTTQSSDPQYSLMGDSAEGVTTTTTGGTTITSTTNSKHSCEKQVKDMTPNEKKRHERNVREQQRSNRISQQIKELRNVLSESNVPFKANKYSILMSVVEYIKQLQNRSIFLDGEMKKLLSTIQKAGELVNSGFTKNNKSGKSQDFGNDSDALFVQGVDFKRIFEQASTAFGIASLDGTFIHCNSKFRQVSGLSKDQLLNENMFNLLKSTEVENAYAALGKFLKDVSKNNRTGNTTACTYRSEENSRETISLSIDDLTPYPGFWCGALQKSNVSLWS